MIRKLFSHSFLYAIGPQVPKLANILVLPLITPFLTTLDYGVSGTMLAYSALFSGVKSLGFDVLLVNSFFKKKTWVNYWSHYFGGVYLFNLFFSVLFFLSLYFLVPEEVGDNKIILVSLIVIPAVLFDTVKKFGGLYFQLSQKPQYIALATATTGVVVVSLNFYTIAHLKMGYMGWFISSAVGSLVMFFFHLIPLIKVVKIKFKITFSPVFWKKSLKVALPTIPHNYSTYLLNSSDRLVMDQLHVSVDKIGVYNLAYVFGGYMEMFGQAVNMAVAPMVTSLYSKKEAEAEKQVKHLIFFLTAFFVFSCSMVALWAKEIFLLLIRNDDLHEAYPLAILIIMSYAFRPLKIGGMNKLFFYEHTNKLWRISFIAGLLNVGLNLIFIPIYGIYAAAVTTFISLSYLAISPYYIREYRQMKTQSFFVEIWIFGVTLLTVFLYFVRDFQFNFKIGCSILFLVIFLIYFFKIKWRLNQIKF